MAGQSFSPQPKRSLLLRSCTLPAATRCLLGGAGDARCNGLTSAQRPSDLLSGAAADSICLTGVSPLSRGPVPAGAGGPARLPADCQRHSHPRDPTRTHDRADRVVRTPVNVDYLTSEATGTHGAATTHNPVVMRFGTIRRSAPRRAHRGRTLDASDPLRSPSSAQWRSRIRVEAAAAAGRGCV